MPSILNNNMTTEPIDQTNQGPFGPYILERNNIVNNTKLPTNQDFSESHIDDEWTDHIGEWNIITKNGCRYCKLVNANFTLIFKLSNYDSEFKRQRCVYGFKKRFYKPFSSDVTSNSCKLHSYNTRSSEKYTDMISVELHDHDRSTVQELIILLAFIYPDLDKYYNRPNNIESYIDILVSNSDNQSIIFLGGVSSLSKLMISGIIFRMLDEINSYSQPEENMEDVKIMMSPSEYKSIIGTKKASIKDSKESCTICCEAIKQKSTVSITSCGHTYHSKCLRKWLTKECRVPTCPTCRKDLRET